MIVAVIQARMSSTRLPGKVLRPLAGKPLLWHIVERIKRCPKIEKVVVATSYDHSDDRLARAAQSWGVPVFRGPLEDVLERFYHAAQKYGATHVVRVTGDNPLTDPVTLDEAIATHLARRGDHTCVSGLPLGATAEVISMKALKDAFYKGHDRPHREHVTVYIKEHPESYHVIKPEAPEDLTAPEIRLTVDTPDDFRLMAEIYNRFYREGEIINLAQVVSYLRLHPEILELNSHVVQKAVREKKILFRVDGYVQRGLGHVMRCLALARRFVARVPVEVAFLMQDYPEGIRKVEDAGYKVFLLPQNASLLEERTTLESIVQDYPPDLIVLDVLETTGEHGKLYKSTGAKVAALDNLGAGGQEADLVINALVEQDFPHLIVNPSVTEYLDVKEKNEAPASPVKTVFVAMGGSDPANLTCLVVKALAKAEGMEETLVNVVLGSAYPWDEQLREVVQDFPGKISIHIDIENMANLMGQSHLAFCAAGMTMFELAALGVPSVVLCQNEGQLLNANYMGEKGAVVNLGRGDLLDASTITSVFEELSGDPSRRGGMARQASQIIDGKGLARVEEKIINLLK